MQWWKKLGQTVCSLLQGISKFQRSPFCICFSWDKAGASWTSFPTLVAAAKCQHPDTLHVLTTASPVSSAPQEGNIPSYKKQETSACTNYFSSPVLELGSCSLPLLLEVMWQSRREGSQTLMMCHITASAITQNRLVFLFAFNKINRKWHPINRIKTFRLQITHFSLRNGRFMLPHSLYSALSLWHVFQIPRSDLLFQTLWALSKIRAQCWKISVGRNPACIELRLHKELQI